MLESPGLGVWALTVLSAENVLAPDVHVLDGYGFNVLQVKLLVLPPNRLALRPPLRPEIELHFAQAETLESFLILL